MKRKYYLRGIGIGIIFASIIMSVAYNTSYKNKISDKEIIAKAKDLGMVFEDEDSNLDKLLTTITPTPTENEPTKDSTNEGSKESPTPTVESPTPTKDVEVTITPAIEPTKEPEKAPTEGAQAESKGEDSKDQKISIEITGGMSSEKVSKLLKSKGIIEDSAAFNQYLVLNKYTKDIGIGTYEIKPFSSYKEISDLIILKY